MLECDGEYNAVVSSWLSSVVATDACNNTFTLVNDFDNASLPTQNSGSIVVTFTATDNCGNASTCTASIIITDQTAPEIDCPDILTMECGADYATAISNWLAMVSVTDDCNTNVVLSNDYDGVTLPDLSCTLTGGLVVNFTATDASGNLSTCSATIQIEDNTDPVINCPENLILECGQDYEAAINQWLNTFEATDACDIGSLTLSNNYDGTLPNLSCNQQSGKEVIFTATDACGNKSQCAAFIYLEDTTLPEINCPTDLVLECDGEYNLEISNWLTLVAASDNCDNNLIVLNNYQAGSTPSQNNGLTITFTAYDDCGNTASCSAMISLADTQPPSIVCVDDLVLNCDGDYSSEIAAWLAGISATDICDATVTLTNDYDGVSLPSVCNQDTGLVVTFTATDDFGNSTNCVASIFVVDMIAPKLNCPDDLILNCGEDYSTLITEWLAMVTGEDDCSSMVSIENDYDGFSLPMVSCDQSNGLLVNFIVYDDCENSTICSRYIFIIDDSAPLITCPPAITISCDSPTDPLDTGMATATDSCDATLTITYSDDITASGCPNAQTITRTWMATDDCGNSSSCVQIISIAVPQIGLAKSITEGPVQINVGEFKVVYEIKVQNTGDLPLENIQVTDDLTATFAGANSFTVTNVSSSDFVVNPAFNGNSNINLLVM
jgi:uncharacterized repeat protein (TIGR01451 family)